MMTAMQEKVRRIMSYLHPERLSSVMQMFLRDETISGKLILGGTLLALIVVNTPLVTAYEQFWNISFGFGLGEWSIYMDLRHWINEALMATFFLVVGLEIKRELVRGELRDLRAARLPIIAAIGGMIVPALVYVSLNMQPEVIRGWGIPIATDIAFAVGILMILGKRVPVSLKIFLLTLAIVDDLLALIIIALFYAEIIHYGFLVTSVILLIIMFAGRHLLINRIWLFMLLAPLLWAITHLSGVHASIIGAALGLLAPVAVSVHGRSVAEVLERMFLPVSTFVALPLFAFANAGIVFSKDLFTFTSPSVVWGILLGLVFGKMAGIVGASWIMVKLGQARLPEHTRWSHIVGVGFIAGIGFTVSLFITELAFGKNAELFETAKISIFIASVLSAVLGYLVLSHAHKREQRRKNFELS